MKKGILFHKVWNHIEDEYVWVLVRKTIKINETENSITVKGLFFDKTYVKNWWKFEEFIA